MREDGLVEAHAYSLLQAVEVEAVSFFFSWLVLLVGLSSLSFLIFIQSQTLVFLVAANV